MKKRSKKQQQHVNGTRLTDYDESVSVMVTRSLPQDHTVQSFCDGESRGIKVLFKHSDKSVQIFFRPDGTIESANIVNENIAAYRQGFSVSYIIAQAKAGLRRCFSGKSDTLPPVAEADIGSPENQRALGIIDNANPEWEYSARNTMAINDLNTANAVVQDILAQASTGTTVEHSQTIGNGVIITSTYRGGSLLDYTLFMQNEGGGSEVVGLNRNLAVQSTFPLRQNFGRFATNVGAQAVITTSGNGNNRQVRRFDLVERQQPSVPQTIAPDVRTQCVTTQTRINGAVVSTQQEGDCEGDA